MVSHLRKVAVLALIGLGSAIALSFSIDFLNVGGISDRLNLHHPVFWHFFREGSIIEMLTWICLASVVIISSYVAATTNHSVQNSRANFFFLLSIAFSFMLLEDAGNIRHTVAELISPAFESFTIARVTSTFVLYSLLASLIIFITWRYAFQVIRSRKRALIYAFGFLCYAIAAISSPTGNFWYEGVNESIGVIAAGPGTDFATFNFMDHMYEESLELLGAISFLYFVADYLPDNFRTPTKKEHSLPEEKLQQHHSATTA